MALTLPACSTLSPKAWVVGAALAGGAAGSTAGTVLSPNDDSRVLNALVFGLSSALVGGGIALWATPDRARSEIKTDLKTRELGTNRPAQEYLVQPEQPLPDFLKKRVQPAVIEEFTEKDSVTEEGTLHEPHKAYRIKRQAELTPLPADEVSQKHVNGDTQ